jgi:hypothetical protein
MLMLRTAIKSWLPLAVVATFAAGVAYVAAHQVLRQSANDPQIQQAEDWADQIVGGTDPNRLQLGPFIDPTHSLANFGIVYDQDGNIVASSVSAPSTMKQPSGVFDSVDAASNNESRYTWQPASAERYAAVIKRANLQNKSYYVLAARNLRLVEQRANNLMWLVIGGLAAALVTIAGAQNLHLISRGVRTARKK